MIAMAVVSAGTALGIKSEFDGVFHAGGQGFLCNDTPASGCGVGLKVRRRQLGGIALRWQSTQQGFACWGALDA